MDDRELEAIRTWSDKVPSKSGKVYDQDPAVQAYMEAKLALFRSTKSER